MVASDPYPLAFLPMLLCAIVVARLFWSRQKSRGTILLFGIAALLATFSLLDVTREVWLGIPFLSTAQFAWRMTMLINLGVAVAIGWLPTLFNSSRGAMFVSVCVACALIGNGVGNLRAQPLDAPRDKLTRAQMTRFEVNTRALGFGSFAEYLPLSTVFAHIEDASGKIVAQQD